MIINILGNPPKKEEIEKYKNYLKIYAIKKFISKIKKTKI